MKYISDGTWFDRGTEAELLGAVVDYHDGDMSGLFRGIKDGHFDEEVCLFSEFEEEEKEVI